jgi:alkyl hydroperoxide reductase subunit D
VIAVEDVRGALPEAAKDIRLNLQSVLEGGVLSDPQKWGVAAACAIAARNPRLRDAVLADALGKAGPDVVEDARAAAVLMAMNNVYYRFRHMVGKPGYSQRPARLRMQRIAQPLTNKVDFELFCLAVSAINGCEACVRSHEQVVVEGGLGEEHVHDAVRIASVVHAAAVALEA